MHFVMRMQRRKSERDLSEPAEIEAGVRAMANDVWAWCEKAQAFGRTVTVKVKKAGNGSYTLTTKFAGHKLAKGNYNLSLQTTSGKSKSKAATTKLSVR